MEDDYLISVGLCLLFLFIILLIHSIMFLHQFIRSPHEANLFELILNQNVAASTSFLRSQLPYIFQVYYDRNDFELQHFNVCIPIKHNQNKLKNWHHYFILVVLIMRVLFEVMTFCLPSALKIVLILISFQPLVHLKFDPL